MEPKFVIFVETATGEIIRPFTWTRDAQSGIDRASRDAKDFGVNVIKIWAEEVQI